MMFALALWLAAANPVCRLDPSAAPEIADTYPGIVRGPATAQEVLAQTAIAVTRVRAPLSAKYEDLPRVFVIYVANGARHGTIAAVIDGDIPQPGEAVVVASRHRDPDSPCAFIPWTVTKGAPGKPVS